MQVPINTCIPTNLTTGGKLEMLKLKITRICSIENCGEIQVGRNMCRKHYQRWWRYGDATFTTPLNKEKFWTFVDKTPGYGIDGDCWIFTGHKDEDGYGRLSIEGQRQFAHRYVFFLVHGRYPEPMGRHACDNPPCCRPDHIIEGTHQDNMDDKQTRGRQWYPKGELHGAAKLTSACVHAIRGSAQSLSTVAMQYGVSSSLISMIKNGKRWTHL